MNKLKSIIYPDTLKAKLRFFIINLMLLIVLLISLFLIVLSRDQIKNNYIKELNSIVRMQNLAIEKWLSERELDIRFLASTDEIKSKNIKFTKRMFENFVNNQSEFYYISLVDLGGNELINSTFDKKYNYKEKDFFKDSLDGIDSISKASINNNEQIPLIHFSSPVFNSSNEVISIIVAAVRLSSIQAIVESFRFSRTGETFIINKNNELLTKRIRDENIMTLEKVKRNDIKDDFYVNYNGETVLGTYLKTNFDRWYIIAQISEEEIYELFKEFILYIFLFVIVLFSFLMPLVLKFSNKIVKPLEFLLHGSKRIENGEYGHKINSTLIQHATCELRDLTYSFNSMSDVLKNVIDELTINSTIDTLSKLFNRREFFRLANKCIDCLDNNLSNYSILMVDIDFFKKINDNYGHQTGDIVIELVSNTIKTSLNNEDLAGRYGGEEFIVFIKNTKFEEVLKIANRIRTNIEDIKMNANNTTFSCTVSIGCCFLNLNTNKTELNEIINKADLSLYDAKKSGRNKVISLKI